MQINWLVENMTVLPSSNDLKNVVVAVRWRAVARQDTHEVSTYGVAALPPVGNVFAPYENLVEDQVLNWVFESGVEKAVVEADLENRLDKVINPLVVVLPIPWSKA